MIVFLVWLITAINRLIVNGAVEKKLVKSSVPAPATPGVNTIVADVAWSTVFTLYLYLYL